MASPQQWPLTSAAARLAASETVLRLNSVMLHPHRFFRLPLSFSSTAYFNVDDLPIDVPILDSLIYSHSMLLTPTTDPLLAIICLDNTTLMTPTSRLTGVKTIGIRESIIEGSPVFRRFINSQAYRRGKFQHICFTQDHYDVLKIIKRHLTNPMDEKVLHNYLNRLHNGPDCIPVLVRLMKLAEGLELYDLTDTCQEILWESAPSLIKREAVTIVRIAFAKNSGFEDHHRVLQYCLLQVVEFANDLRYDEDWHKVLDSSEPLLRQKWDRALALRDAHPENNELLVMDPEMVDYTHISDTWSETDDSFVPTRTLAPFGLPEIFMPHARDECDPEEGHNDTSFIRDLFEGHFVVDLHWPGWSQARTVNVPINRGDLGANAGGGGHADRGSPAPLRNGALPYVPRRHREVGQESAASSELSEEYEARRRQILDARPDSPFRPGHNNVRHNSVNSRGVERETEHRDEVEMGAPAINRGLLAAGHSGAQERGDGGQGTSPAAITTDTANNQDTSATQISAVDSTFTGTSANNREESEESEALSELNRAVQEEQRRLEETPNITSQDTGEHERPESIGATILLSPVAYNPHAPVQNDNAGGEEHPITTDSVAQTTPTPRGVMRRPSMEQAGPDLWPLAPLPQEPLSTDVTDTVDDEIHQAPPSTRQGAAVSSPASRRSSGQMGGGLTAKARSVMGMDQPSSNLGGEKGSHKSGVGEFLRRLSIWRKKKT